MVSVTVKLVNAFVTIPTNISVMVVNILNVLMIAHRMVHVILLRGCVIAKPVRIANLPLQAKIVPSRLAKMIVINMVNVITGFVNVKKDLQEILVM